MLFQRKHVLAASQMEACRRVEITGVLTDGAELASNAELGGDAQRASVGAARVAMGVEGGWLAHGGHR